MNLKLVFFLAPFLVLGGAEYGFVKRDPPPEWFDEHKEDEIEVLEDIIDLVEGTLDRCLLPADPGMCKAAIPSWYYNHSQGTCEEFLHGGCPDPDANVFTTQELCYRSCRPDICMLEPETGPCRARIFQWFYDAYDHSCKQFEYGGCDGNPNKFSSEERCYRGCAGATHACMVGDKFVTVGKRSLTRDYSGEDWFTYSCEFRCRKACIQVHSWGTCYAFSTIDRWYGCDCFMFNRPLSKAELDQNTDGLTRNRACALDDETLI